MRQEGTLDEEGLRHQLEQNLNFIGITAVEDKLQD